MEKTRIVFMGTADFSKAVLEMLIKNEYHIVGVVSQPDRMVGRKRVVKPTMVKELAEASGIVCLQPEKIRKDYQAILDLRPDLIISAAYGQIIPKVLLDAPRLGCINVHASLLPKLRGGAPVHHAIMDGYEQTGVTIMYMAEKMDAGDMLASVSTPIHDNETVGSLYARLTDLGAALLEAKLPDFIAGKLSAVKQDEKQVTYAPTISREDEHLSFAAPVRVVDRHVRALNPWPCSFAVYQTQNIKIWKGQAFVQQTSLLPGTIVGISPLGIEVACQDGIYRIEELQIPGKKRLSVAQLINGKHPFEVGSIFE